MTQNEYIKQCLENGEKINRRTASAAGIERLASRIEELRRKHGMNIESHRKKVPTRWSDTGTYVTEYSLVEVAA